MLKGLVIFAVLAKARLREFFTKEDGEVNIVAIVVLIGIAIVLAIIFRGYITKLLNSLFNQVNSTADNAIAPPDA
ncbi:MAG: flagellin-like protein [Oscillospiraceae bacterium]|jgi:membrane protease YdiL (CAAX protease family)|nr:flagellin-like protein [Oscillospiraceae bacterium]